MNPTEIEFALRDLVAKPYDAETFAFDLIATLNASKMTIGRLRSGATNKAKRPGDLLWQNRLFFRPVEPGRDIGDAAASMATDPLATKNKPRFVIATDGEFVNIRDTKFDETEIVEFGRLDEKSDFLLPLAGYERRTVVEEHPADIKAAKKLKKLYESILAANPTWSSGHHTHELNLLMTRLLFCFYAEKTGIFATPDVFTDAVTQHTYQDPSAVAPLLDRLFRIMNIEETARFAGTPAVDARFPYVNGSLFGETLEIPTFDLTARRQLLECGDLDWTDINPDIFGSMIQTIAQDGTRSDLGMHYTSVPNIMKVLKPLFLDELNEAFEKAKDSGNKLDELLVRLSKIRVFDPACGSGNFLVIAYKALRELETRTLVRIGELQPNTPLRLSGISLQSFYGMDVVDFACETTKLSLWIAEHQTNSAFQKIFGQARPTLPLAKITTVRCFNATRADWLEVCPPTDDGETFICGNPPYLGHFGRTDQQNADMDRVFAGRINNYKDLDYVACWILKLADYLRANPDRTKGALVSTNSIYQGEQVPILWPLIQRLNVTIAFAYPAIEWENNAAHNAGVTCAIVGFSASNVNTVKWFDAKHSTSVKAINFYLAPSTDVVIVSKEDAPINELPPIRKGLKPLDGGKLTLTPTEREDMLRRYPQAEPYIRRLLSGDDLLNEKYRYIIVVSDENLQVAKGIAPIAQRLIETATYRETHGADARRLASYPNRFGSDIPAWGDMLAIPQLVAESRQYVPVTTLNTATIIPTQQVFIAPSDQPWSLAILSSGIFRLWLRIVGGKMRRDDRVSSGLVYNTFPMPTLSEKQKTDLSDLARSILRARGASIGKTLGYLYAPTTTPKLLLEAHRDNDNYIEETIYGLRSADHSAKTTMLFKIYSRQLRDSQPILLNSSRER